jgi:hypothetical protein
LDCKACAPRRARALDAAEIDSRSCRRNSPRLGPARGFDDAADLASLLRDESERIEMKRKIAAMLSSLRTAAATARRRFPSNDTQFLLGRFADR